MYHILEKFYSNIHEWLNQTLWTFNGSTITPLSLVRFAFLICLAIWVSRLVLRTMNGVAEKRGPAQRYMVYRLARLLYYVVMVIGLLIAVSSIGVDFSQLVLLAGALGIGLGIGLQNIFNQFFSGMIILFEDQLKLGDVVELEKGIKGEIREMNFRTLTLKTEDGTHVFVPNSLFINSPVNLNWTAQLPYRCLRIPFAVKAGTDENQISSLLINEAKKNPLTIDSHPKLEPALYLMSIGREKLNFELWVWIDEKEQMRGSLASLSVYLRMIERVLRQQGIELA